MPVPIGASIVLSPQDGINLVWGSAVRVLNFFAQNNLQMNTAVYIANCSIVGGDSEGWRASLQSYHLLRQSKGYTIGSLMIGYPGHGVFAELLSTEYGTRWLGILVIASTIPNESKGARSLLTFLRQVASDATTQLILGLEQCEKIWTLARSLFADSPYYYEFLRIIAECASHVDVDVMSLCFLRPEATATEHQNFFATFMTAAYRLWEMSQTSYEKGWKLWAHGSVGCAQLILYLTVVCGFYITVRSTTEDVHFGDSGSRIEVILIIKGTPDDPWHTGYYTDELSTTHVTQHLITGALGSELWRPGPAAFYPRNSSLYRIDEHRIEPSLGESMLTYLQPFKQRIEQLGLRPYVSKWILTRLHINIYYWDIKALTAMVRNVNSASRHSRDIGHKRTQMQMNLFLNRLSTAIETFAPGIVTDEELEDLRKDIRADRTPRRSVHLSQMIPQLTAREFCTCLQDYDNHSGCVDLDCDINVLVTNLAVTAWKIYICVSSGAEARVLRDIAPDYLWQVNMPPITEPMKFETESTRVIIECIASRLAGQAVRAQDDAVIGLAAGGFVIGLLSQEDHPIRNNPGHQIFFIPGSIEAPERSVNEVIQHSISDTRPARMAAPLNGHNTRPNHVATFLDTEPDIASMLEPCDLFGPSCVQHVVQVEKSQAKVATFVASKGYDRAFPWLYAIDAAPLIKHFEGCLGECVSGRLTTEDLEAVEVLGPSQLAAVARLGSFAPGVRLQVVPAHRNAAVTRAIVSRATADQIMIQAGTCTHCAVKAALTVRCSILIC